MTYIKHAAIPESVDVFLPSGCGSGCSTRALRALSGTPLADCNIDVHITPWLVFQDLDIDAPAGWPHLAALLEALAPVLDACDHARPDGLAPTLTTGVSP